MTLEERLGYFFFDKRILARALTRNAYAIEQQTNQAVEDQDAYCVLGQAVLATVLTELLIRSGVMSHNEITARKTELERAENLARIGQDAGVGYVLKLSTEEKQQQAYDRPDVLAETLAAVIGGIYFDGGYSAARQTIQRLFKDEFPTE